MIWLWLTIASGPLLWIIHISFAGALVELSCTRSAYEWAIHGLTLVTGLPVLAGLVHCLRVSRAIPDAEGAGTIAGRTQFLALFGALTAAISLALILLEGSYVLFISPCG